MHRAGGVMTESVSSKKTERRTAWPVGAALGAVVRPDIDCGRLARDVRISARAPR
jgi:hypothetical protein